HRARPSARADVRPLAPARPRGHGRGPPESGRLPPMLPPNDQLTVCFAHVAYRFGDRFALRNTGIKFVEVRDRAALDAAIGQADVLVCSGMWRNDLPQIAPKLKFVQSASAGTDQYDREVLKKADIRLASGQG